MFQTYIGPDVIRGINVDHWRACLHWTRTYANFTVDYYFSSMYYRLDCFYYVSPSNEGRHIVLV
jgi:hypothetical protein